MRGDAALEHGVLLVDEPGERLLREGDEGHLVGHLEDGEAAPGGRLEQRCRHLGVGEAGPHSEPGELVVGQPGDELALALCALQLHARGEQQLPARQPRRGVEQLGDVNPAHGRVRLRLAGQQAEVEVAQQLGQGQHRRAVSSNGSASGPRPLRGPAAGWR